MIGQLRCRKIRILRVDIQNNIVSAHMIELLSLSLFRYPRKLASNQIFLFVLLIGTSGSYLSEHGNLITKTRNDILNLFANLLRRRLK